MLQIVVGIVAAVVAVIVLLLVVRVVIWTLKTFRTLILDLIGFSFFMGKKTIKWVFVVEKKEDDKPGKVRLFLSDMFGKGREAKQSLFQEFKTYQEARR